MDSAGKMDMSLDDVIKSSRTSDKPGKKGGGDAQLTKAVKQRNKAQRTNKVAAARGMDIDAVPVPMARKGAKNLSSKKKIKIKGKGAVKVKPAKASAKGGKASPGKLTLAAMLQKPLSNASQKSAKGGRGATPTKGAGGRKGAAQVQVTIKNAGARARRRRRAWWWQRQRGRAGRWRARQGHRQEGQAAGRRQRTAQGRGVGWVARRARRARRLRRRARRARRRHAFSAIREALSIAGDAREQRGDEARQRSERGPISDTI